MKIRALITGGAGFIGHHIVEHLLKNTDWDIVILDRLDVSGNPNRLTDIECYDPKRVQFIYWDLKSPLNDQVVGQIGAIDYVIHLAAGTHVDRSILDPQEFVLDNVLGTTNILDWAVTQDLRLFINFSTDEVYGPAPEGYNYKESDPKHPKNPYAAAKLGQEAIAEAFENTYQIPIITTHTMNVIGERQHPEKFVPLVINKVLKGETVQIHAYPDLSKAGSRYYIHARNVADAMLFLLNRPFTEYEEFNIVGEIELDNLALAQMIAIVIGQPLRYELVDFHSSRPGHDLRYGLDGKKMAKLGWRPPMSFSSSLTSTVKWYLKNRRWL